MASSRPWWHGHRFYFFLHLCLAAFVFSDFLLYGRILVGGSDAFELGMPLLVFARRAIASGHLGLWNPYLLNGVSSLQGALMPVLSPDSWLSFLVPERFLFQWVTILSFLKFWLIGGFGYLVLYEELGSERWAFFGAVIYQLCGYSLWAMTQYETISIPFYFTLLLYGIWTAHRGTFWIRLPLLASGVALLLLSANLLYGVYAVLALIPLAIYRVATVSSRSGRAFCFVLLGTALVFGISLAAVRLVPARMELMGTIRDQPWRGDLQDYLFLALRLFNPEQYGVFYGRSVEMMPRLVYPHEYLQIHWAMPHFFGGAAALLFLWRLCAFHRCAKPFWIFYTLVALGVVLFVDPFDSALKLLLWPASHGCAHHIFLPIGFAMVAAHAGQDLERERASGEDFLRSRQMFSFLVFGILLYLPLVWATDLSDTIGISSRKIIVLLSMALALLVVRKGHRQPYHRRIPVLIGALALVSAYFLLKASPSNGTLFLYQGALVGSVILMAALILGDASQPPSRWLWFLGLSVVLFLVLPWEDGGLVRSNVLPRGQDLGLAIQGFFRFVLVVTAFFLLIDRREAICAGQAREVYSALLCLLFFELLPAAKVHSHISIVPFYGEKTPYDLPVERAKLLASLNTRDYRFNRPNLAAAGKWYHRVYQGVEMHISSYLVQRLRGFGGYYNTLSQRAYRFASAFGLPVPGGAAIIFRNESSDPRFLDLSGVRYDFDAATGKITERGDALARFMIFHRFEIIPDPEAVLARLRQVDFSPLESVILEKSPGISIPGSFLPARRVSSLDDKNPDALTLSLDSPTPAILFFGDSFHEGWRLMRGDQELPLMHANYAFMAAPIPAGHSVLQLTFLPAGFQKGIHITAWAGALLALLTVLCCATEAIGGQRPAIAPAPIWRPASSPSGVL